MKKSIKEYQQQFLKLGYILSDKKILGVDGLKYYYIEIDKKMFGSIEEHKNHLGTLNSKYTTDFDITLELLKNIL